MRTPGVIAIECSADTADALGRDGHLIERQGSLRRIGDVVLRPERVEGQRGRAAETQVELLARGRREVCALGAVCPRRAELVADPVADRARIVEAYHGGVVLEYF